MFHQAAFNRTSFNRGQNIDVWIAVTLGGTSECSTDTTAELSAQAEMSGTSEVTIDPIREIFVSAQLDGVGELRPVHITRDIFVGAVMDGVSTLEISAKRYHVDAIEFKGELHPGDQLVMDSQTLTFRINGQNALHQMQGDFFHLNVGDNAIVYTDTEAERSMLIRVTHRDKFV